MGLPAALRIGLLHLAPVPGDLEGNEHLVLASLRQAAALGAEWVVTGELVRSGYAADGAEASLAGAARFIEACATATASLGIVAFVHSSELGEGGLAHSTMFALDHGRLAGAHRKIAVIPGAEAWATAGRVAECVRVGATTVGMLVCADAHPPGIAGALRADGAEVLVSSAAWNPGEWGPDGEWEERSADAGVPVIVANRTGPDRDLDFTDSESAVAIAGEKVLSLRATGSTIFLIDLTTDGARTAARLVRTEPVAPRT